MPLPPRTCRSGSARGGRKARQMAVDIEVHIDFAAGLKRVGTPAAAGKAWRRGDRIRVPPERAERRCSVLAGTRADSASGGFRSGRRAGDFRVGGRLSARHLGPAVNAACRTPGGGPGRSHCEDTDGGRLPPGCLGCLAAGSTAVSAGWGVRVPIADRGWGPGSDRAWPAATDHPTNRSGRGNRGKTCGRTSPPGLPSAVRAPRSR